MFQDVHANPAQTMAAIATGIAHTVALKEKGTVLSWEGNSDSQLGDGTTINRHNPVEVVDAAGNPLSLVGTTGTPEYGVTIITHGYQFPTASMDAAPGWAKSMGAAILKKRVGIGKGRLWQFDVRTGLLIDLSAAF